MGRCYVGRQGSRGAGRTEGGCCWETRRFELPRHKKAHLVTGGDGPSRPGTETGDRPAARHCINQHLTSTVLSRALAESAQQSACLLMLLGAASRPAVMQVCKLLAILPPAMKKSRCITLAKPPNCLSPVGITVRVCSMHFVMGTTRTIEGVCCCRNCLLRCIISAASVTSSLLNTRHPPRANTTALTPWAFSSPTLLPPASHTLHYTPALIH